MCKITVEIPISSTDEKEFDTTSFPDMKNLTVMGNGKLARVVNGVIGFYLDITGPVSATANDGKWKMHFNSGVLSAIEKIV